MAQNPKPDDEKAVKPDTDNPPPSKKAAAKTKDRQRFANGTEIVK